MGPRDSDMTDAMAPMPRTPPRHRDASYTTTSKLRSVPYASTSADPAADLPPLSSLQAWVHRPQAVAKCFVSDVFNLCALEADDGVVKRTARGEWTGSQSRKVEGHLFTLFPESW